MLRIGSMQSLGEILLVRRVQREVVSNKEEQKEQEKRDASKLKSSG